ncbi:MAG: GTPase KRas precursor [Candidatus Heimdallarchaeota archaeon LC_3]|nr:MAG: GTPase KRas precursor [Candidatus Heimdallarchaeota archaeon LC_3]
MIAKILLCGDGYVGKTTIRERYIGIDFRPSYLQTIGADYTVKNQSLEDGRTIKLQIWDLAGQQRFAMVRESFYKGTNGIILVFDVTNPSSMDGIFNWIEEIKKNLPNPVPMILVGNKVDLREKTDHSSSEEQGKNLAEQTSMKNLVTHYIESSAITGENIKKIFQTITQVVMDYRYNGIQGQKKTFSTFYDGLKDLINLYLFKLSEIGPVCAFKTNNTDDFELLTKMGIFYSTTIGQGVNAHEGVFGPLPLPESKLTKGENSIQLIIFSFHKKDRNYHDERAKGINFAFIVITLPEDFLYLFSNKNIINRFFHSEIEILSDLEEINKVFLDKLKQGLVKNLYLSRNEDS